MIFVLIDWRGVKHYGTHVTFTTMFIFRVAVEIKAFLAIRDLRERRETKVKRVHQDQEEKEYVTFVAVL